MEKRPILQLKWTKFDYFLEFLAIGILIFHWIYILYNYSQLPQIVPSHWNINGNIDGMGPKSMTLLLPMVGLLLFLAISYTNKKPHSFNFPYPITEENAERQYRNSLMMTRIMKMLIQLLFLCITANIISIALPFGLKFVGFWMFPFGILLVFINMIFFVIRGVKLK